MTSAIEDAKVKLDNKSIIEEKKQFKTENGCNMIAKLMMINLKHPVGCMHVVPSINK